MLCSLRRGKWGLGDVRASRQLGKCRLGAEYCNYEYSISYQYRYEEVSFHHHTTGQPGTWSVPKGEPEGGPQFQRQENDSPKGTMVFKCNPKDSTPARQRKKQPTQRRIYTPTHKEPARAPAHRLRARISSVMSFIR